MKNRKIFLLGACAALVLLLVGPVLYFFSQPTTITTELEIHNWALVSTDGEIVETMNMELHLCRTTPASPIDEHEPVYTDVYTDSKDYRYQVNLASDSYLDAGVDKIDKKYIENPYLEIGHKTDYIFASCSVYDKYIKKGYHKYCAINVDEGLFIVKHPDSEHYPEHYIIGSADENYDVKMILEHFSLFVEKGYSHPAWGWG